MDLLDFSSLDGTPVPAYGSAGLSAVHLLRGSTTSVTILRVEAGGEIGRHPTTVDQLFVVLSGTGSVRSGDGPWLGIAAGQAALWRAGEDHTTRATTALAALVVESAGLV